MIASVDSHSETAQVIAESGCGVCIEPEHAPALAEAVRALYGSPERAAEMGRCGRTHVEAHYTRTSVAHAYEAVFARLTPGKGTVPPAKTELDTAQL